jgi:hypothetical protein
MISIEQMEPWKLRAIGRLMSKVDDSNGTGCWEWRAATLSGGYGMFYYGVVNGKEKMGKAHRARLGRYARPSSLQQSPVLQSESPVSRDA